LALKNKLEHPLSVDKDMTSRKWLRNFLVHNACPSLQRPESVSFESVIGFTKENATLFFDLLMPELEKVKSSP
jgi:hypothetical protein